MYTDFFVKGQICTRIRSNYSGSGSDLAKKFRIHNTVHDCSVGLAVPPWEIFIENRYTNRLCILGILNRQYW
jgi:hypothetical protein